MKIIIFGTGAYYQEYKRFIEKCEIVALIDNDSKKWGKELDGVKIYSPSEVLKYSFDYIYILSSYDIEMRDQLRSMGIAEEKICDQHDLWKLGSFYHQHVYDAQWNSDRGKRIFMISHDLLLRGAQIALYTLARALKERGYQIIVASPYDGPLRKNLIENNIPVIIYPNLVFSNLDCLDLLHEADLIVVNTSTLYYLLREYSYKVPVIWWLHESKMLYDEFGLTKRLSNVHYSATKILACSEIAKADFGELVPNNTVDILTYGFDDEAYSDIDDLDVSSHSKRVFAIIGAMEERKGQDIFLDAIQKMSPDLRQQCEFWFIGPTHYSLGESIKKSTQSIKEIRIFDEQDRQSMKKMYSLIDVLVCPSREESMSIVSIEAMMFSKPCIVTSSTGISRFIQNGIDGFVVPSENVDELLKKMEFFLKNPDKICEMGKLSRKIFENNFLIKCLAENFIHHAKVLISES